MPTLRFNEDTCATCPTTDCMMKCQYISWSTKEDAHAEWMKVVHGENSRVLHECMTCYSCEEYCKRGNHPCYLIAERREEKGMLTASRAVTNQWINMTEPQGRYKTGKVEEKALSCCFIGELRQAVRGKLFSNIGSSYVMGAEFFCQVMYLHFAKISVIKERLQKVVENISRLGIKELICMHDECYGSFTSLAPAFGIDVPFKPIHYLEYLYGRLQELKNEIKPLNIKAAYQRPCSSRLSPDKYHFVGDILNLIGVELPDRKYQGENALCCGEVIRLIDQFDVANDIQKRNVDDMVATKAEYCVFNCPYCQMALSEKVSKNGMKPIHIIDLCRMAIGEL